MASPRAYYLHYILKLRRKQLSSALVFGNAIDQALNFLLEQKQASSTPDPEEAKFVFLANFLKSGDLDLRKKGVVKFSKADLDPWLIGAVEIDDPKHDPAWYSLQQKAHYIIDAYIAQVLPRLQEVIFVQRNIEIKNEDGDVFRGLADFCARYEDGKVYLFDNKTSSVKYAPDATAKSEQLATYYEAMRHDLQLDGVGYVVIPKTVRHQKLPHVPIDIQIGPVDESVIDQTFSNYERVLDGIRLGQFPCTPEKCCKEHWGCDYRQFCESGGKDLSGLEFVKEKK
jgi:hypothetical protein